MQAKVIGLPNMENKLNDGRQNQDTVAKTKQKSRESEGKPFSNAKNKFGR